MEQEGLPPSEQLSQAGYAQPFGLKGEVGHLLTSYSKDSLGVCG